MGRTQYFRRPPSNLDRYKWVERMSGVLQLRWHVSLWLGLLALSVGIVVPTDPPVAGRDPLLAAVLGTLAGTVSLAVLQLGLLRFLTLGHMVDLLGGLGFGVLAVSNLFIVLAYVGPRLIAVPSNVGIYLMLLFRSAAALLFVVGLLASWRVITVSARQPLALRVTGVLVMSLAVGAASLLLAGDRLPDLLVPQAYLVLAAGESIDDLLPGQSPALMLANGLIAALLGAAMIGYLLLARRLRDPQVGWLAIALGFLCCGQAHAVLFPFVTAEYASSGDIIRLAGYLVLLFSLVNRLSDEVAQRASHAERLRLSRELHDGIAQQLTLLHMRLGTSGLRTCSDDRHTSDLEFARRQVESTLLEARHAITALRTGALSWDRFCEALNDFVDEFAQNHLVEVQLSFTGDPCPVDAGVQAEILRILYEAFSNALRHGAANQIDVTVQTSRGWLHIRVSDDGRGFDTDSTAAAVSGGVGLVSMRERLEHRGGTLSLTTGPGHGVTVEARLPSRAAPSGIA